jgi:hypothetical protein
MIEELELILSELKEAFAKYNEKKSFTGRKDVRKILQKLKVKTQEMRVFMLNDFK